MVETKKVVIFDNPRAMKKENTIKALRLLSENSYKNPLETRVFAQRFNQAKKETVHNLLDAWRLLMRLRKLGLVTHRIDNVKGVLTAGWYMLRAGKEEIVRYNRAIRNV